MVKEEDLERRAVHVLESTLQKVPSLVAVRSEPTVDMAGRGPDFVITVKSPGGYTVMVGEVKSNGEPRLAREAANQLLRYRDSLPDAYGVFVAPYISPQAAEVCREAGIGYHDLAGNCLLSFGGVYIERQGNPNPDIEKRGLRTLYSPKATRVLRVMLQDPKRRWKLQALADEARVSLGQVHKVKSLLADREWSRSTEAGVSVSNPSGLLWEWAANYSYRKNRIRQYHSLKPVREIEESVAALARERGYEYALAGFSAAERLAPFVRYQRATLYLESTATEAITQSLGFKEVTSGANVALWAPYDDGVFYGAEERGGVTVTSPIQTYLDLYANPARGREGADFLLEKVVKPKW